MLFGTVWGSSPGKEARSFLGVMGDGSRCSFSSVVESLNEGDSSGLEALPELCSGCGKWVGER